MFDSNWQAKQWICQIQNQHTHTFTTHFCWVRNVWLCYSLEFAVFHLHSLVVQWHWDIWLISVNALASFVFYSLTLINDDMLKCTITLEISLHFEKQKKKTTRMTVNCLNKRVFTFNSTWFCHNSYTELRAKIASGKNTLMV